MKLRLNFFDDLFKQQLPELKHHFEALDLSPDFFVTEWYFTLYTKALPCHICQRIWDIYILDGEVFAYRVAIGILLYYQRDLLESSFQGIILHLKKLPADICETNLFKCID